MKIVTEMYLNIKKDIDNSKFGNSGERFFSARKLSEIYKVSYVTARKILAKLVQDERLSLVGKFYLILNNRKSNYTKTTLCKKILIHTRDVSNTFFSFIAQYLFKYCLKNDIEAVLVSSDNNAENEKKLLINALSHNYYGIINFNNVDQTILNSFYDKFPLPMVIIGKTQQQCKYIKTDNYSSGKAAALHLIGGGYSTFAYVGLQKLRTDERKNGFIDGLKEHGFCINRELSLNMNNSDQIPLSYFIRQIKTSSQTTGIFCYHDLIAVQVLNECLKKNLSVPEKVGIIGYDNLPISTLGSMQITTFSYNYNEIAEKAINLLFSNTNNGEEISTALIKRASTINGKEQKK